MQPSSSFCFRSVAAGQRVNESKLKKGSRQPLILKNAIAPSMNESAIASVDQSKFRSTDRQPSGQR
jgi:hypothetical protein